MAIAAPNDDAMPQDPKARELLEAGSGKFEAQDYEGALADFKASYDHERHPITLGAMAQATNKVEGCRKAVPLFRELSQMVEQGSDAYQWTQEAIVYCADKMVNEEAPLPPPPEFEADPDSDETEPENDHASGVYIRPWYKDPLGAALVGVGGVGLAAGIGLVVGASVEDGKTAANYEEFVDRTDRVNKMRIAGAITASVGGALLIGGVVRWAVLGARQNARVGGRASARVGGRASAMVLKSGGGVVFSGRF